MLKNKTLLIMAAGMGSRFGGLKQIEPVGPNKEFIIDYSIYDAKQSGFNKVVFVIKKENYEIFKETIGNRISKEIQVEYAFQELHDLPGNYNVPSERKKPFGTTQAILAARNLIHEPFATINADNFYGREAFQKLSELLDRVEERKHGFVSYYLKNTLSEYGAVKRGICREKNGYLEDLVESKIDSENGEMIATPLLGGEKYRVSEDALVSVNLFAFSDSIFSLLEKEFKDFLEENRDNLGTCESVVTDVLGKLNKEHAIKIMIEKTNLPFYEITYHSDLDKLKAMILDKTKLGEYPKTLWR